MPDVDNDSDLDAVVFSAGEAGTTMSGCRCCASPVQSDKQHFCSTDCCRQYFTSVRMSNPMPAFCTARGIELKRAGTRLKGFCPFHTEKTPSFYVFPDGGSHCFGCGWDGTVIDLCAKLDGLSLIEAAMKLGGKSNSATFIAKPVARLPKRQIRIPPLQRPTRFDLQNLSASRAICVEALVIAVNRGFLWVFDEKLNGRCWIFTDRRRKCAIRRRIDNQPFQLKNGDRTKAAACADSDMTAPLGYEEAQNFQFFGVAEGGPNGLAIIAQALACGVEVAPIVMPCTGARFTDESLSFLQGKRGRIFIDNDPPGRDAASRWASQLRKAGIAVDGFSFAQLKRNDGAQVKDINDLCLIDADCHESYSGVLASLMNFAAGGLSHG